MMMFSAVFLIVRQFKDLFQQGEKKRKPIALRCRDASYIFTPTYKLYNYTLNVDLHIAIVSIVGLVIMTVIRWEMHAYLQTGVHRLVVVCEQ